MQTQSNKKTFLYKENKTRDNCNQVTNVGQRRI